MSNKLLLRFFPFLQWFPVSAGVLRGDLVAGITGALVLVPKAMAYAQLSGLPLYFGLYAAFVPAILGALWGSSRQLATGPVAIVSLMTAAAVTPLALPYSEEYIGLALLLTLLVGLIQLTLGVVKLGTIVNFVSHPVILGFMNAAAIIIGLSQLDMLLGIPKGRSDFFLQDIWEMLKFLPQAHLPTLAMAIFGLVLMLVMKKISVLAKASVLIAVVVTIMLSYIVGFEHKATATIDHIATPEVRELVAAYDETALRIREASAAATGLAGQLRQAQKEREARLAADLRHRLDLTKLDIQALEAQNGQRLQTIHRLYFLRGTIDEEMPELLYQADNIPPQLVSDGRKWHIKKIVNGEIQLVGGGDVVGQVPAGLPSFRLPTLSLDAVLQLLTAALIIALVAFMESISMAKAMASKNKQHIDPNQELIGQGMANIGGSFFQAYPASGSFTGSAINLQAGAKTGFAMVFNGLFVAATLLFLTPLLYHLPKAVLAVIILLAVTGLVTPQALKHTWKASRADGIVALVTFTVTLLAAPHLDKGIIIGAALSIGLYLYRSMAPRVAILGRHEDGTLRDLKVNPNLTTSPLVTSMRFDGSLYFANIAHFEDAVLEAVAKNKEAKYLLVVGDAINYIDSSGEEMIHHLVAQLRESGVEIVFSGLKKQILDVMRATGLYNLIGEQNIFSTEDRALTAIFQRLGDEAANDALLSRLQGLNVLQQQGDKS
ncbi:SulP family inorganic anion transporter [Desulfurivibrio sp. C05AmB]|jgi:sulfate permease, SulP family|uniref:SulP family inorganic anion transporter n=1 Tax=Desulfurivibrio sp. C05AmB TaxID=3374371 RepID=UPI00376EF7ED